MTKDEKLQMKKDKEKSQGVSLFPNKLFNDSDSEFEQGMDSIASRTYMRGLVLGICDSFKRPVVVLQRNSSNNSAECKDCKDYYTSYCAKRKFSRLESTLFYEHWAVLCKKIRHEKKKNYCCRQDELVAEYLLNKKDKLTDRQQLEAFIDDNKGIWGEVKKENDSKNAHICIRYHCPRSQYDELAININVNGIEGVIILGQFQFAEDNSHKNQMPEFKEVLDKYLADDPEKKEKLLNEEKLKFDKTVKLAFECVNELEKALIAEYNLKIDDHVRIIQEKMVKDFGDNYLEKASEIKGRRYNEVKECTERYKLLKTELAQPLKTFISSAGENICKGIYYCMPEGLHFESDLELFKDGQNVTENNKEIMNLLNGLSLETDSMEDEKYYILKKKLDLHEEKYIYMVFDQLSGNEDKVKQIFDNFLQFICLEVTQLYARYNGSQIDLLTKVMRHELGQLNEAILIRINAFEEALVNQTEDAYTYGFLKECEYAIENYRSHAHSVMLRANSSRYFSVLPPLHKEGFYPYDSFLYKWRYIYEKAAKNKQIDFVMDYVHLSDLSRPRMYADKSMIEQVAYNLTNNALKYSIAGTTIKIDCKLNENKDHYQLIVTNYGWPIKEEEKKKIFQYGYRGENQSQESGFGLGLYLSKEIAEQHEGTLELYTEIVSAYDVSCLFLYEDMPSRFIDTEKKVTIDSEILRLKQSPYKYELKKPKFKNKSLTPYWINQYLGYGTMKYTFILSIPYNKRTED